MAWLTETIGVIAKTSLHKTIITTYELKPFVIYP